MSIKLRKVKENIWEIKQEKPMLVPGIVFASDELIEQIQRDKTLEQVKNVSTLPGIVKASIAMPDAHQGYGFSVGGVAAFDSKEGIVSPGGVGFDINCGVRLLTTNISKSEFMKKRSQILNALNKNIPSGVGHGGSFKFQDSELDKILINGSKSLIPLGYATEEDIENTEDSGCIKNADPKKISQKAKARGRDQLGTIGAGNHFIEIQEIQEIFDDKIAESFNLNKENIVIMIHTGSRGLGHQTASDYINKCIKHHSTKNLSDKELAYAPLSSDLGKEYLSAMACAANFAFANRQLITHQVRQSFLSYFPKSKIQVLYDVAHNIAKFEEFNIDEKKQTLCIHRKGATRSFGPGRKELPKRYQKTGQPILIPGSMGTNSYVLVGTKKAEEISFASTAHGAGRVMSRTQAKRDLNIEQVKQDLKDKNIELKSGSNKGLLEEAPQAYKDVNEVVRVSHELGIGNLVAKLKPLAVVKG